MLSGVIINTCFDNDAVHGGQSTQNVCVKDARSVSCYPYNHSRGLQYVEYFKCIESEKRFAK